MIEHIEPDWRCDINLLREALLDADGYLEADDGEERPDPSNIRRRLREKIHTLLAGKGSVTAIERAPQSVIDAAITNLDFWTKAGGSPTQRRDLKHAAGVMRNLAAQSFPAIAKAKP